MSATTRTVQALRRPHNWIQLFKFGLVGASGFAINLVVYKLLLGYGAHAAASNYWWNRHWTFAGQKGSFALQGMRFYAVSVAAFVVNQIWLVVFIDWLDWGKVIAQAVAIVLVTPLNFLGNKLWSFRR